MKDLELDQLTGALSAALQAALREQTERLGRTMDAVKVHGAEYRSLVANGTTTVTGSSCRLIGWALAETTGTGTATVTLHDGATSDGQTVAVITLAANESARDYFGPGGISLPYGLYASVTGSVAGSLFLGAGS